MVPNKINYGDFKTPFEDIKLNLQYLPGKGENLAVHISLNPIGRSFQ